MARELFECWDSNLRRYIYFEEFTMQIVALGLAEDMDLIRSLFFTLKGPNSPSPDQIDLKEFMKLFHVNRFGQKANVKIIEEFQNMYMEFAKGELARIVGVKKGEGLTQKTGKGAKNESKGIESAEADIQISFNSAF